MVLSGRTAKPVADRSNRISVTRSIPGGSLLRRLGAVDGAKLEKADRLTVESLNGSRESVNETKLASLFYDAAAPFQALSPAGLQQASPCKLKGPLAKNRAPPLAGVRMTGTLNSRFEHFLAIQQAMTLRRHRAIAGWQWEPRAPASGVQQNGPLA